MRAHQGMMRAVAAEQRGCHAVLTPHDQPVSGAAGKASKGNPHNNTPAGAGPIGERSFAGRKENKKTHTGDAAAGTQACEPRRGSPHMAEQVARGDRSNRASTREEGCCSVPRPGDLREMTAPARSTLRWPHPHDPAAKTMRSRSHKPHPPQGLGTTHTHTHTNVPLCSRARNEMGMKQSKQERKILREKPLLATVWVECGVGSWHSGCLCGLHVYVSQAMPKTAVTALGFKSFDLDLDLDSLSLSRSLSLALSRSVVCLSAESC
jgi:hypothetical protein